MTMCPVKHCNQPAGRDTLACHSHWAMVPKEIKDEFRRICRVAFGTPSHMEAIGKIEAYLAKRAC